MKKREKNYLSMQLFGAVATMFCKIYFYFFALKKLKKPPSKVAHNWPKPFISQSSPAHSPELIFHLCCRDPGARKDMKSEDGSIW